MHIYVPDLGYQCYYIQSEGVIRAYEEMPKNNSDIAYRDYYLNSNYIYKDGIQSFGSYSTLPICLDNNVLTDSVYYRNDFDSILIIFIILIIFCFYYPFKIIGRAFGRWLRI